MYCTTKEVNSKKFEYQLQLAHCSLKLKNTNFNSLICGVKKK